MDSAKNGMLIFPFMEFDMVRVNNIKVIRMCFYTLSGSDPLFLFACIYINI